MAHVSTRSADAPATRARFICYGQVGWTRWLDCGKCAAEARTACPTPCAAPPASHVAVEHLLERVHVGGIPLDLVQRKIDTVDLLAERGGQQAASETAGGAASVHSWSVRGASTVALQASCSAAWSHIHQEVHRLACPRGHATAAPLATGSQSPTSALLQEARTCFCCDAIWRSSCSFHTISCCRVCLLCASAAVSTSSEADALQAGGARGGHAGRYARLCRQGQQGMQDNAAACAAPAGAACTHRGSVGGAEVSALLPCRANESCSTNTARDPGRAPPFQFVHLCLAVARARFTCHAASAGQQPPGTEAAQPRLPAAHS